MDDKTLYELCVASGFIDSEWWPHHTDQSGARWTLTYEHEEWVSKSGIVYCSEGDLNARARILAGLVEWIGESRSHWTHIKHANGVDIHAAWMGSNHEKIGTGENPTLALLSCYAKHAAKAKEAP